ncbi:conserved Plasmodium protein, unknown function [Plasmodium berghei]|uniref:Uncharacterized protein n=2 Tax=Plasmodium berghei TaxID=5821 RepID=A0A509AVE2_PLABA|nr:conserved protein, unknown function [Plasmodium berghei ANKA]CXJ21742.1 conserved Plasmodium protein, unknown function [Plasmodium berghei]SCM26616.1 conserved Plasmodium protein, unknown function [Plasmodium berghei]SCN28549.1 conserved Plasmodium protein, unknown function [Plasmodium berghei]SCO64298.1 conserved Plasmodium protein, unknown function [Plasmodium berghei]VUC58431.1 conserved protein, unknown function [Plasmodium berghei ANKA]|eukprot:XP_034424194.1 conserved protein, unknown function [Plasmodium berghei ANKA]
MPYVFPFINIVIIIFFFSKSTLCILTNKNHGLYPVYSKGGCVKSRGKFYSSSRNYPKNAYINNATSFKFNVRKTGYGCQKEYNCANGKEINHWNKKKVKENILFAESNFFNPKQFKILFPQGNDNKEGGRTDGDGHIELEKLYNLKDISPDLYKKLIDYNKQKEESDLNGEITKEKGEEKNEIDQNDLKNYCIDEGLPLLMIDGKDFHGFPDTRKIKITPKISTNFNNEEYNEFVKRNGGDEIHKNNNNESTNENKHNEKDESENNYSERDEEAPLNDFERKVKLMLEERTKNGETICNNNDDSINDEDIEKKEYLSREDKINKYKKVGKNYHMDSTLGEILFDRNYPGYIYLNHGKKLKELDEKCEYESELPKYINPNNIHLRTGRMREKQKKRDSGIKQKKRWESDNIKNDIKRGNWKYYDDTVKDLLDSIDQEKLNENYYSNNYYQRTNNNTGYGSLDKTQNNYFDVQFIGSAETYPANISVGMNFIWPINFIPLLCKQYPKRLGQPIKSDIFNLGGFDSLQLWFYPDGMNNSIDGYCSLKLVMKPGSFLPVKIFFFAFSEYNYIHTSPFYKESSEYVTESLNLCKLLLKSQAASTEIKDNNDYVILGPASNVYIGVGIYDKVYDFKEDFRKFYSINNKYKEKKKNTEEEKENKYNYKYDWDEGVHIFDNWLKKQTAITDDKNELLPVDYTHSDAYENYKYTYVPEKNPFKFLRKNEDLDSWNRHPF